MTETLLLLEEQDPSPSTANELKKQLGITEEETDLGRIWDELRRRIANGPSTTVFRNFLYMLMRHVAVTTALLTRLSAYMTTFLPIL